MRRCYAANLPLTNKLGVTQVTQSAHPCNMSTRTFRQIHPWLLASFLINVLLAFILAASAFQRRSEQAKLTEEIKTLEQSVHTLYRVLPKNFYTRNEFAMAIALPGMIPTAQDCVVQYGQDVFVFDRANTIIGMYRPGPNPFVPEPRLQAGYKCDRRLLDKQTQRSTEGASAWAQRIAPAHRALQAQLEKEDPSWGKGAGQR